MQAEPAKHHQRAIMAYCCNLEVLAHTILTVADPGSVEYPWIRAPIRNRKLER